MLLIKTNNKGKEYTKGFSLIELMVVICIIAILATVAIPSYIGYMKNAKEKVCNINCLQLQRMYEAYLGMENIQHTDAIFQEFLQQYRKNICPNHGDIIYIDGKVRCSVHIIDDVIEEDGDVPFL